MLTLSVANSASRTYPAVCPGKAMCFADIQIKRQRLSAVSQTAIFHLGDLGHGLRLSHNRQFRQRFCLVSVRSCHEPGSPHMQVKLKDCTPSSHRSGEDPSLIQNSGCMKRVGQRLSD